MGVLTSDRGHHFQTEHVWSLNQDVSVYGYVGGYAYNNTTRACAANLVEVKKQTDYGLVYMQNSKFGDFTTGGLDRSLYSLHMRVEQR